MRPASLFTLLSFIVVTCAFAGETVRVTKVIDGDTFEISTGDKVRMIGINTPESRDFFGKEAREHLASLIEGQTVELVPDEISKDRDRYKRLLRYVFLDGRDINRQMIEDGFAHAYLKYKFERAKEQEYSAAQMRARNGDLGIWGTSQPD